MNYNRLFGHHFLFIQRHCCHKWVTPTAIKKPGIRWSWLVGSPHWQAILNFWRCNHQLIVQSSYKNASVFLLTDT